MSKTKSKSKDAELGTEERRESQSYQQMLEDVEGIVRSVSGGPLDLDEVVTRVERGYKLIKQMRERLDTTKAKVERLRTEFEQDDTPKSETATKSSSPKTTSERHSEPADDDDDTPF